MLENPPPWDLRGQGSKPDETDETHQVKKGPGTKGEAARAKPPEEKTTEDKLTNSKTHERDKAWRALREAPDII